MKTFNAGSCEDLTVIGYSGNYAVAIDDFGNIVVTMQRGELFYEVTNGKRKREIINMLLPQLIPSLEGECEL